jgi:diaminopimelate epimerase
MRFVKYHGCGNYFVIMREAELGRPGISAGIEGGGIADLARRVCHRQLGVGADGLIDCRTGPLTMDIINSDGSVAPMCGNGVRCFARYCVEEGIVPRGSEEFDVHTLAGAVRARVSFDGGFTAEIDMGRPDWSARAAGVDEGYIDEDGEFIGRKLAVPLGGAADAARGPASVSGGSEGSGRETAPTTNRKAKLSSFFMGTYHTVVWLDENQWIPGVPAGVRALYESEDIDRVGRALESHPAFTQRTNVDFARVTGKNAAEMITWERGAGLTAACGTGACAVAALGIREGRFGAADEVRVSLPYGELFIRQEGNGEVFMRGPAERVFSGEY